MITYEGANTLLDYDANTGIFVWKEDTGKRRLVGTVAGTTNDQGYRLICIHKKDYRAHRLAWFLTYGRWPHGDIDHINGRKDDNRIINLRECTRTQNLLNAACPKNSKSGIKGVYYCKTHQKWVARIGLNGKRKTIGYFNSKEEAFAARVGVANKLYGSFARHV